MVTIVNGPLQLTLVRLTGQYVDVIAVVYGRQEEFAIPAPLYDAVTISVTEDISRKTTRLQET